MAEENLFVVDRKKAIATLNVAKEKNANKTVPIRVNAQTVVYITEEQSKDKKFMDRFWKYYK